MKKTSAHTGDGHTRQEHAERGHAGRGKNQETDAGPHKVPPDGDPQAAGDPRIDIAIQCQAWRQITHIEDICRTAILSTLKAEKMRVDCEISVLLTDDRFITELNQQYRGRAQATNVLSFPQKAVSSQDLNPEISHPCLGDVALSWETVQKEATHQGKKTGDHVRHLIVHGVLHLLGHDHIKDDDANRMENTERRILSSLGISDPYAEVKVEKTASIQSILREERP